MADFFTRQFSEISGGRFDPLWLLFNPKVFLKNTTFCVETLGKIIVSAKTGFAAGKENQTKQDGIIQIRPTNLDEHGILKFDKNIYVPKDISIEYLLQKGEVLFNNTNSQELVGKTAYFDLEGKFTSSNHITRIQTDTSKLLPQYLAIILNVYQRNKVFFNICVNWNNQSGVNVELLKNLLIPLPPLSTQQYIIDIMDTAYKTKKDKETKAKNLLDSIDSYLLQELGIILPPKANNTLDSRIYTQNISALSNSRFDANYHQKYYQDLEKSLSSSPYPLVNLGLLIANFKKGIEVGSDKYSKHKEIPFIRVSDITNKGIDFSLVQKFISTSLFENLKDFKPKENELLYSKDGTIGICLKADVSSDYIISGGIVRLEVKEGVDKDFLCFLLGSFLMNIFANRLSIGAVIKHLNIKEFLSLKIPLPPLYVQTQIANKLKMQKYQALNLEKEAKEILTKAKINIQELLLASGGGGGIAFSFEEFSQIFSDESFMQTLSDDTFRQVYDDEDSRQVLNDKNSSKLESKQDFSDKNFNKKDSKQALGDESFSKKDHLHFFDKIAKIWNGREYAVVRLGEVARVNTKLENMDNYEFINYIDIASVSKEIGAIEKIKFLKSDFPSRARQRVFRGDLLISGLSGSQKAIVMVESDEKNLMASTGFFVVSNVVDCLKEFLMNLLRTQFFQELLMRESSGAIMASINQKDILNLKIPLPTLAEQERIAKEISQRKARAKILKQEANAILESAKKEIENLILKGS